MKKSKLRGAFYSSFCRQNFLGSRLETARLLMRDKGYIVGMNRTIWSQTLHMQKQIYGLVVKGTKPIPSTVWASLFLLGFSLDWFATGTGTPLHETDGRIPILVEEIAKKISGKKKQGNCDIPDVTSCFE